MLEKENRKGMMHIFILIPNEAWIKVLSIPFFNFLTLTFLHPRCFDTTSSHTCLYMSPWPQTNSTPVCTKCLQPFQPSSASIMCYWLSPWGGRFNQQPPFWLIHTDMCSQTVTPFLWAYYICICPSPTGQAAGQSPRHLYPSEKSLDSLWIESRWQGWKNAHLSTDFTLIWPRLGMWVKNSLIPGKSETFVWRQPWH